MFLQPKSNDCPLALRGARRETRKELAVTAKSGKQQTAGKAKSRRVKVEALTPDQAAKQLSSSEAKQVIGGRLYRSAKLSTFSTSLTDVEGESGDAKHKDELV
jgi:hypothetical protein